VISLDQALDPCPFAGLSATACCRRSARTVSAEVPTASTVMGLSGPSCVDAVRIERGLLATPDRGEPFPHLTRMVGQLDGPQGIAPSVGFMQSMSQPVPRRNQPVAGQETRLTHLRSGRRLGPARAGGSGWAQFMIICQRVVCWRVRTSRARGRVVALPDRLGPG